MKIIIAGGRNYYFDEEDMLILDDLHLKYEFTEIISGGASGADSEGERFAKINEIPIIRFAADWSKGRLAGHIRNDRMAKYASEHSGGIILFKGGPGTANMRKCAKQYKLKILYDGN